MVKRLQVDVNNVWDEYPAVAPRLGVLMALDAGGLTNLRTSHYIPLAQLQLASLQLTGVGTGGSPPPIAFRVCTVPVSADSRVPEVVIPWPEAQIRDVDVPSIPSFIVLLHCGLAYP